MPAPSLAVPEAQTYSSHPTKRQQPFLKTSFPGIKGLLQRPDLIKTRSSMNVKRNSKQEVKKLINTTVKASQMIWRIPEITGFSVRIVSLRNLLIIFLNYKTWTLNNAKCSLVVLFNQRQNDLHFIGLIN